MTKAHGILICGGGTGGHVMPGLALAAACRAAGAQDIRWIGDPERLEARLVPAAQIPLLPLGLSRPRPRSPRWLLSAVRRAVGCWWEMQRRPPRLVVALGGYAALLPALLAPWLRRPLVVLEQNAWPGRTNRLVARQATAIITQFPEAARSLPGGRVYCMGNPVRSFPPRERGRDRDLTVLVMGGSLAAQSLNDCLAAAAPHLAALPNIRLIHLAGEADCARMGERYAAAGLRAEVHGFITDMAPIYAAADIAICRSGATTVSECRSAGLGAIYIPLPWAAEDHQRANARAVARGGGAVVVDQGILRPQVLVHLLRRFAEDRSLPRRLGERARAQAHPQAAAQVAALCQAVVGEGRW